MLRLAERAGPGGEHDHCASVAAVMLETAAGSSDRDG